MQKFLNFFKQNLSHRLILQTSTLALAGIIYYKRENIINKIDSVYGSNVKSYEEHNSELQKLFLSNLNVPFEVI